MSKVSTAHTEKEKGFALLMAIVVSGIVLSLGITISFVALRQLQFASTLKDSQLSFYASEAGAECARYWGLFTDADPGGTRFSSTNDDIECNGKTYNNTAVGEDVYQFVIDYTDDFPTYPYRAEVEVVRSFGFSDSIVINSEGYNAVVDNGRLVQRFQKVSVSPVCRPDIMLVLDRSRSICSDVNRGPGSTNERKCSNISSDQYGNEIGALPVGVDSEKELLIQEIKAFIAKFSLDEERTKVGQVSFGKTATLDPAAKGTGCGTTQDCLYTYNYSGAGDDLAKQGLQSDINVVNQKIENFLSYSGDTNIAGGLRRARIELEGKEFTDERNGVTNPDLAESSGLRDQLSSRERNDLTYPDYIILVTDGRSTAVTYDNELENLNGDLIDLTSSDGINEGDDTGQMRQLNHPEFNQYSTDDENFEHAISIAQQEAISEAQKAKNAGITVYVVGIGINNMEAEQALIDMATSENHYFSADFDQENSLREALENISFCVTSLESK